MNWIRRVIVAQLGLLLLAGLGLPAQQTAAENKGQTYYLGPPPAEGPVQVGVAFHLNEIDSIDDEAETVQFTGVLTLSWRDPRQAFDPAVEGVEEKVFQGEYQFNELSPAWYPQVVLANESGMFDKSGTVLRVRPDGTSVLVETVNAIVKTTLDLRRYPFDAHRLQVVFEVLGFSSDEVELVVEGPANRPPDEEVRVSEWEILEIDFSTGDQEADYAGSRAPTSTFVASIGAERKPFFMLRLVILPLILIVALSWAVFWMDRSSLGDRINVSFIGILTAVAYQMLVSDNMPQIAYMTFLNAFLSFSFFVMAATVVINLVVGACDQRGDAKRGDRIDFRCRWMFPLLYAGLIGFAFLYFFVL
ncbi:MAG: hypothetical protein ACYTG5_13090 [Planctomycetota bacterium]